MIDIIKKADYYYLFGDNIEAKKFIERFIPEEKWNGKLKKALTMFYSGMDKISEKTESLIEGIKIKF